jgi:hypothetical protein
LRTFAIATTFAFRRLPFNPYRSDYVARFPIVNGESRLGEIRAPAKAAEATAKTAGKASEIVHDVGGYLGRVFGDVPADLVEVCYRPER